MALTLAERLVEAEAAYHAAMTGGGIAEVRDSNGESIRYTASSPARLLAYIAKLKAEIAGTSVQVGPLSPMFG